MRAIVSLLLLAFCIGKVPAQTGDESTAPAQYAPAVASVKDRMIERRAIEAAVWGMPIVNFQAMRDGLKKGAGSLSRRLHHLAATDLQRLRHLSRNFAAHAG